jgi:chromosomal replication initiator protein
MVEQGLWRSVINELQADIKKADLLVWFQGTGIIAKEQKKVKIGLPSIFAQEWFSKRYRDSIMNAFKKVGEEVDELDFEIDSSLVESNGGGIDMRDFFKSSEKKVRKLPGKQEVKVTPAPFESSNGSGDGGQMFSKILNPKYRLDNFIIGSDNRLAHAACSAVARKPGGTYNPLFVYGDVGLGKTHLLQGTGNTILDYYPDMIVVYGTAEKFTNEIIDAIKKNDVKGFRNRYRRADCLIIDDIQFLAKKSRTQEEFFHTFNELYDDNKQIILSSDRPPKELDGIEERLVSRFEMGMIVDVTFPDFETRLAILHKKTQEMEMIIAPEVLEFIACNVQHSIRELEGVLVQAMAQAQLDNSTPTSNSVARIMKKLGKINLETEPENFHSTDNGRVTNCNDLIGVVAKYFKLEPYDLVGDDRSREVMVPRQICMYILRKEFNFSFEKIGEEFGGRNHTTAMHAYQKMLTALKKDHKLVRDVNAIKREIGL